MNYEIIFFAKTLSLRMSTLLKNVDERTKLIVNGYVRDTQKLISNWTIPDVIIDICIRFYHLEILWDFGGEMKDSKVIVATSNTWKTVTLNQSISNKMCNIFEFEITVTDIAGIESNHFFIGFIKSSTDKLKEYKEISFQGNDKISEAVKFQRSEILLNGHGNKIGHLPRNLDIGDKVRMIFDFKQNNCKWFWNDKKAALVIRTFDTDTIIPALSPFWASSEFEITDYCFK